MWFQRFADFVPWGIGWCRPLLTFILFVGSVAHSQTTVVMVFTHWTNFVSFHPGFPALGSFESKTGDGILQGINVLIHICVYHVDLSYITVITYYMLQYVDGDLGSVNLIARTSTQTWIPLLLCVAFEVVSLLRTHDDHVHPICFNCTIHKDMVQDKNQNPKRTKCLDHCLYLDSFHVH